MQTHILCVRTEMVHFLKRITAKAVLIWKAQTNSFTLSRTKPAAVLSLFLSPSCHHRKRDFSLENRTCYSFGQPVYVGSGQGIRLGFLHFIENQPRRCPPSGHQGHVPGSRSKKMEKKENERPAHSKKERRVHPFTLSKTKGCLVSPLSETPKIRFSAKNKKFCAHQGKKDEDIPSPYRKPRWLPLYLSSTSPNPPKSNPGEQQEPA